MLSIKRINGVWIVGFVHGKLHAVVDGDLRRSDRADFWLGSGCFADDQFGENSRASRYRGKLGPNIAGGAGRGSCDDADRVSPLLGRPKPLLNAPFHLPTKATIDRPLVIGAAVFGLGWWIAGLCLGPGAKRCGARRRCAQGLWDGDACGHAASASFQGLARGSPPR